MEPRTAPRDSAALARSSPLRTREWLLSLAAETGGVTRGDALHPAAACLAASHARCDVACCPVQMPSGKITQADSARAKSRKPTPLNQRLQPLRLRPRLAPSSCPTSAPPSRSLTPASAPTSTTARHLFPAAPPFFARGATPLRAPPVPPRCSALSCGRLRRKNRATLP